MYKKIKKYIKSFVCIMLIVSLISPSYAIIAGTDGSSFVSKQEFEQFANEITSRITIFEAGINSKIDAQVTSYLDRNGIWNGKYQELIGGWTKGAAAGVYTKVSAWNSGSGSNAMLKSNTVSASTPYWIYNYGFTSVFNSKNLLAYKLISKLTKSGLMCFTIETRPNDSSNRTGFVASLQYAATSTLYEASCPNVSVDMVWSEEANTTTALPSVPNEKARIRLTTGDFTIPRPGDISGVSSPGTTNNNSAYGNFHVSLGKQNVYYFVAKGNSIWIYYNFIMSYKSSNNASNFRSGKDSGMAHSGSTSLYLNYTASACVY